VPLHRPGNVGGEADAVDVSICRSCGGEDRLDEAGLDIRDVEEDGELIEKKSDRNGDQRRWLKREVLSGQGLGGCRQRGADGYTQALVVVLVLVVRRDRDLARMASHCILWLHRVTWKCRVG
jgi:hypothetical protein